MEYAWYATGFPESGGFNRIAAFAAMLTVLAMATQVGAASHGDLRGFILAFVVFHANVVALFLRASRLYPGLQRFSIRYATGFGLAAVIWLVSLAVPNGIRQWVWIAALAVDLATPWAAVVAVVERTFHVRHIPERYGFFTIIVLGEAVIAVARSMSEARWTPQAVTAAIAGFAIAVVNWWAYFAHPPISNDRSWPSPVPGDPCGWFSSGVVRWRRGEGRGGARRPRSRVVACGSSAVARDRALRY
jgi:low temperature requirement protein LtrA